MKNIIGNKAKNLIKLVSIGVNVPNFVCISDTECRNLKLDKLEGKIEKLSFPMMVRSSSEEEDSLEVSGAGKYYSIYNIHIEKDLYKSIKICWKNRGKLDAMGIIVQEQLIPRYSGVAFMQKIKDCLECVVEAVFGLGDTLVSGYATPKRIKINLDTGAWEVTKEDNQRIAQIPRVTEKFYEPAEDILYDNCRLRIIGLNSRIIYGYMIYGYNYWKNIKDAIEKLIPELRNIYKELRDSDVEWVYGIDGKLSIVQRRPITASLRLEIANNGNGTCIVPGKVKGRMIRYNDYKGEQGVIIFAKSLNPKEFLNIINCGGLITIENTLLSHTAILAREFNIPYYCGIAAETIVKYIDCVVNINFETGMVTEGASEVNTNEVLKQSDSEIKETEYNILSEAWTKNYFLNQ